MDARRQDDNEVDEGAASPPPAPMIPVYVDIDGRIRRINFSIGSRLLCDGLFWADAATFLMSAVLLRRVAAIVRPASAARTSNIRPFAGISPAWHNRPFAGTSLLNGVLCLHITLLSIGITLLIVQQRIRQQRSSACCSWSTPSWW